MGVILDCACIHCKFYQDGILLGSDTSDDCFYFPALHAERRKIIQINIHKYLEINERRSSGDNNEELERFRSEKKLPYFEQELFEWNGSDNEILSENPYLQVKYNFCPKCEQFGLQFNIWGPFE
jgi:hypothetical protein